jgi:serine/threonine protein kinase/Tol biopolymer transport system component
MNTPDGVYSRSAVRAGAYAVSDQRWPRVEDIFHRAVELAPQARSTFLDEACGPDQSLRTEVESLLDHESENGNTFDGLAHNREPETIAHYRISGKLGQGGMGVVYRAMDTKLGREVAIKVLPRSIAEDADRLARFTREAKVLASLNHPNIAQIYGIEDRALVMELVPGATLTRPLPMETALNYAKQIAEALEAAHERGIVHRDLKPANIVVTPEGVVKLLDFGLAAIAPVAGDPLSSPTITMQTAKSGVIMGTAAYMSPEQAAGKPVDKRADIWSFGVVLWEMLTGRRLFEGETISVTLASVLRSPIDFDQLPRDTPPVIRDLLRRCLDRDVKNRLRDVGEARIAIESVLAGTMPPVDAAPARPVRSWLAWSIPSALALGLCAIAVLSFREKTAPSLPLRFQIAAPENSALEATFSVSPDGRKVAFKAAGRLWVHSLESGESRELTAADGVPLWSADSRFIAYPSEGKIKKIDAAGGAPQIVADLPGSWGGGAWNRDDVIVFGAGELYRVSASGGVAVPITALDPARKESMHFGPSFLPDGQHFVYIRRSSIGTRSAIYVGAVDAKPEQQSSAPLVNSDWQPRFAPSKDGGAGYLLFVRDGRLMVQPFDNRRLELKEQPSVLAERVSDNSGSGIGYSNGPTGGWAGVSTSANDVLVFQPGPTRDRQLTWFDRAGKPLGTVGEPAIYQSVKFSPDGTRLAVSKTNGSGANIWLLDLSRGTTTRFTFSSAFDTAPVWSPDGRQIIFSSNRNGPFDLYQKPSDGGKDEELLLKSGENKDATDWSPDGRFLLYIVNDPKTGRDVWVLPLEGDKKPAPFLNTRFQERNPHFSPDGRWVAYNSDESGHMEVYVRSFSVNQAGATVSSGKWQISNGDGTDPSWRRDGKELYYWTSKLAGMAVEIATSPEFKPGKPQPLGVPPFFSPRTPTADGQRFLMPVPQSNKPEPYTVVMNWQAGLKK